MTKQKALGKGLATSAQLAMVAFLTLSLSTNTHDSVANTSSSVKTSVPVAAPSKADLVKADKVARRDYVIGALSERQANIYRVIFSAQKKHQWERADSLIDDLDNLSLMGHVLADRFERRGASPAELTAWLKAYPTLPEAKSIYKRAIKLGAKDLTKPRAPRPWSSGGELDKEANFVPRHLGQGQKLSAAAKRKARIIRRAIQKGRPTAASKSLALAVQKGTLSGAVRYDLESMIAGSYFHHGMKDQAIPFAQSAAAQGRPLGLWISGLIAWGKADHAKAYDYFGKLAAQKNLAGNNKAAASFWAYRAAKASQGRHVAHKHLKEAAKAHRSFYGMLASRKLGRNPVANMSRYDVPEWNKETRAIIKDSPAGQRALALIQVGEVARSESELRRMNPRGDADKKNAMLALASHAHMPALALRVAYLTKNAGLDSSLYPVLPWAPHEGFSIDRAFLFALAKQESLFNPNAKSSAGAQGLLQIMPATANGMVKGQPKKLEMVRQNKLLDPSFNMTLGQKYVQTLTRYPKIGKNLVMILASYNAGPNKAMGWLERSDGADPLYFLETIPVKETRHYVARVLSHYWAYRARLGRDVPSLKLMAAGQWPRASLDEKPTLRVANAY